MKIKPTFHIFGSTGMLGSALSDECTFMDKCFKKYSLSGKNSIRVNISDQKDLKEKVITTQGDYIINLAAIAQPQEVLKQKSRSYDVNVRGNSILADLALTRNCKYFLMSSVEVFGRELPLLDENTIPRPVNEYGRQKLEAEKYIQNCQGLKSIVGRTSWNISMNGNGRCLIDVMLKSLRKEHAYMATDNYFTIASSQETARNIIRAVESKFEGVVHIASPSPISRYNIARLIKEFYGTKLSDFKPCKFKEINFQENRSRLNILDSRLSILEFEARYSDPISIILKKLSYES